MASLNSLAGRRVIDGTFGAGGYSRAMLDAGASVCAIDRDPAVVRFADSRDSGSIRWLLGPRADGHAVVVLGRDAGQWLIGDPAIGRVRWSDQDFRRRFTGDAIYLARANRAGDL